MIEMSLCPRILIVDSNRYDFILLQEILKAEISDIGFRCATNKLEYLEALDQFHPDIVLSDDCYPAFLATEALMILREKKGDIPFIFLSRSMSEEMGISILAKGANDYLLKDRLERLPFAVAAALKQQLTSRQIVEYRSALNEAAVVAIADTKGNITHGNKNCCKLPGFKTEELIANKYQLLVSGVQHPSLLNDTIETSQKGIVCQGEFLNQAKDGQNYSLHTIVIPFLNERNQLSQYLANSNDVTEQKKPEAALNGQACNHQLKMAARSPESQEKERNFIGQESDDQVNQILVATRLLLSLLINGQGESAALLKLCDDKIHDAIQANRKIADSLATPGFES